MHAHIANSLNELLVFELAMLRAYEEAIEGANSVQLRAELTQFMTEHHQHHENLSALVRAYGGTPAERRNIRGVLMEALTAIVAMGDFTALLAMRRNERMSTRMYYEALRQPLTPDVRAVLLDHYTTEVRHLSRIEDMLTAGWGV